MRSILATVFLVNCFGILGLAPGVVRAQVVIRERVEIRPGENGAPVASLTTGHVTGYWVYYSTPVINSTTYAVAPGTDAALTGTLEVTTSGGVSYAGSIAGG